MSLNDLGFIYSVPAEDPSGHSLVIDGIDFERIKNAARVLTAEEKAAREEALKRWKEEQIVSYHM